MSQLLVSELFRGNMQGNVEICGKIVYVEAGNKNIIIKGKLIFKPQILTSLS